MAVRGDLHLFPRDHQALGSGIFIVVSGVGAEGPLNLLSKANVGNLKIILSCETHFPSTFERRGCKLIQSRFPFEQIVNA